MDEFEKWASKREAEGSKDLARRIRTEGKIARKIVATFLERGYTLSVNDSEEWTVLRSTNKEEIVGALFTTDSDKILARKPDGESIGAVFLVYGNDGYDVVCDYTARPEMEEIMESVINPYCEKLEAGR